MTTSPLSEERRGLTLAAAGIRVTRADDDDSAPMFTGHAAVFNSRAAIGNPLTWGFYEEIAPGAFTKTLGESDARFLIDHSSYHVVARASAGSLHLAQDGRGLITDAVLDTRLSYVNDLVANLDNGNIRGMSFGFHVVKDEWAKEAVAQDGRGEPYTVEVRTIREVKLIEVSAVTFPAYEETDAGLRHSLVPALRHRGDVDAIARAALACPELAPLLGYDPELAPKHIDMSGRASDDPKKPYGDVKYADPGYQEDGKKRYPIDTKEHCLAAWSYINQAGNASKYTAEQLKAIKGRIKAALKKYGVEVDEDKSADLPGETLGYDAPIQATGNVMEPEEVREPGESTRNIDTSTTETELVEPGEPTPPLAPSISDRMRALAARYNLPAA